MKSKLLLLFLLSFLASRAQDQKWSLEANYPVSVGDSFDQDGKGILDLGIKYRFTEFGIFKLGAGLNAGLFYDHPKFEAGGNAGTLVFDYKQRNLFIQPGLFLETEVPGISELKPFVGLGYSWVLYKASGTFNSANLDETDTQGGLNLNIGLSYDLYKNWFLQAQYDFIALPENSLGNKTNIGLLKFGVGFRF